VQQVLEAEMTSFLGAGSFERSGERRGWRNGFKPWVLKTRVGELELLVPKDREGQFQTVLFERYRRSEKALVLSMLQMYIEGVLTRKVSHDHRYVVRSGGEPEPGVGLIREAGPGVARVAQPGPGERLSVPGDRRAL
jgi:transposase-like protein